MLVSFILQKGAPDLTNAIIIMIAILFSLLLINSLYEWIRSKPWQDRNNTNPLARNEEVNTTGENNPGNHQDENSTKADFTDYQSLGLPIGC
jgi:hypothetical protein